MMNWKYLLTGVLAGSTLVLRAAGEAKDECPNILFILSDDHTSQTWGIYGGILSEYARQRIFVGLLMKGQSWIIVSVQTLYLHRVVLLY